MGVSTKCMQYLFFAFNFIFFALGIAILAVGIYSSLENKSWEDLIDATAYMQAGNLLLAAGTIVAILGFLGCCGGCKRWNWMLMGYAAVVVLIFILQIAAGIYAYTKRETLQKSLEVHLMKGVNLNYGVTDDTAAAGMTKAIDYFQQKVHCCGLAEPNDWRNSKWKNGAINEYVPDSCCKDQLKDCGKVSSYSSDKIYQKGCVEQGNKYIKDNLWLIGGVAVGIGLVQLLGVIFSLFLCKAYREDDKGTGA